MAKDNIALVNCEVPLNIPVIFRRIGPNIGYEPYLKSIGKLGGKARAKNMSKRARSKSAKKAADARWGKKK